MMIMHMHFLWIMYVGAKKIVIILRSLRMAIEPYLSDLWYNLHQSSVLSYLVSVLFPPICLLHLFDFGDEWTFQCKVLRVLEEQTPQAIVIKSKGEAPLAQEAFL